MNKERYQFNLFLFIANLTEWHFSCRKNFNKVWRNIPSSLSKNEKSCLNKIKSVLKLYNKNYREHLTIEFLNYRSAPWKNLETKIGKANVGIIKKSFEIFSPRFEYFYNRQKSNMNKVFDFLNSILTKNLNLLSITQKVYLLSSPKDFKVIVTLSENSNHSAGGMCFMVDNMNYIIMQFGDFEISKDNWIIEDVLCHEIGHCFQNGPNWANLVSLYSNKINVPERYKREGVNAQDVFNEVVNASLWGEFGILSQIITKENDEVIKDRFVSLSKKNRNYYEEINWCAFKFRPAMTKMIKNKLPINEDALAELVKIWNKT